MSAFMVNRDHIVYMVQAAESRRLTRIQGGYIRWQWGLPGDRDGNEIRAGDYKAMARIANALRQANIESIEARYPDCVGHPENRPGIGGERDEFDEGDFTCFPPNIDPAQVMRACSCFEYQACEYRGWEASEAHAFTDILYRMAAEALCREDAERRGVELHWEMPCKEETASA